MRYGLVTPHDPVSHDLVNHDLARRRGVHASKFERNTILEAWLGTKVEPASQPDRELSLIDSTFDKQDEGTKLCSLLRQ
jgi:hypothetical protein